MAKHHTTEQHHWTAKHHTTEQHHTSEHHHWTAKHHNRTLSCVISVGYNHKHCRTVFWADLYYLRAHILVSGSGRRHSWDQKGKGPNHSAQHGTGPKLITGVMLRER